MANDGEVTISTKVDTSGLDKGLRTVKDKVNKTSDDIGKGSKAVSGLKTAFNEAGGAAAGFAGKMQGVAAGGGGVGVAITAAVLAAKKYIETLKEANEAYKVQENAEKALQKAADNNPYLNGESVRRLKDYAGELQKISNYGDEGTIDIMAQLASTGRTESEIMKIMGAAADYAAAKHIDLRTAAETLNSTYSGMAGTMGRQIADIKDLTDEQLKNGDAIDLIASKYKGFAEEAADSGTQAKNAFGDFMESIGRIANPTFEALNRIAKSFFEFMTDKITKLNDALETASRKWGGTKAVVDEGVDIINSTYTNNITGEERRGVAFQTTEYLKYLKEELEWREELTDEAKAALFEITLELQARERLAEAEAKQAEAERQRSAELAKQNEARKAADDYARDSNKKLQESLNALEVEARAKGEAVSAQDKYNVYLQSYIDLLTKTEGAIREGYPIEQKRLEQLKEAKKALDEAADAEEKLAAAIGYTQAATEAINSIKRDLTTVEVLDEEINRLEQLKARIEEMSDAEIEAAQAGSDAHLSKTELIEGLEAAEKQAITDKVNAATEKETSWWDKYKEQQKELQDLKEAVDESEILSTEEKYEKMKELDEAYKQSKANERTPPQSGRGIVRSHKVSQSGTYLFCGAERRGMYPPHESNRRAYDADRKLHQPNGRHHQRRG